jgi:hypothetical protein
MAAATRYLPLFGARRIELQQLLQHCRSGLVHAGTNRHLHRFQIQTTSRIPGAENKP